MTYSAFCSKLNCDMTGFWAMAKLTKAECKRMKVRENSNFIITIIENMNDSSWFKEEYDLIKKTGITGIMYATDIRIQSIGASIERRTAFQTELTGLFQLVGKVNGKDVVFYKTGEATIDNITSADMFADLFSGEFTATLTMSSDSSMSDYSPAFPDEFVPKREEDDKASTASLRSSFYNTLTSFRIKGSTA